MKKIILILFFSIGFFLSKSQEKSYYLGPSNRLVYNVYGGPYDLTDSLTLDMTQTSYNNNFGVEFQYKNKINQKSHFVYRSRILFGLENGFEIKVYEVRLPRRTRASSVGWNVKQILMTSGAHYHRQLYGPLTVKVGLESRFHPMIENRGRYDDELLDILEGNEYEEEMKPIFYEYFNSIGRFSLSYTIGATFSILKNMDLNVEYETNFTNLVSDISVYGREFKVRKRNESINVAILFKLNKKE